MSFGTLQFPLRFGCRSAFREKTKQQGFCSRLSFLSEFAVFRAFSVSVFGLGLGRFRLWLSSAFSFLFLFLVSGRGVGRRDGGDVSVHGDAASDIRFCCFFFLFSFAFVGVSNPQKTPQKTGARHQEHPKSKKHVSLTNTAHKIDVCRFLANKK